MSSVSGANQYPNPTQQIDQYVASSLSTGSNQTASAPASGLVQPIQQAVSSLGGSSGNAAEGFLNTYL